MNRFSLNLNIVKRLFSTTHHRFAHNPAIQFIGKRSAIPHTKHIINDSHSNIEVQSEVQNQISEIVKKSLSVNPNSTLSLRPKLSQEEIDTINNGGLVNYKDWSKIKLKTKKMI